VRGGWEGMVDVGHGDQSGHAECLPEAVGHREVFGFEVVATAHASRRMHLRPERRRLERWPGGGRSGRMTEAEGTQTLGPWVLNLSDGDLGTSAGDIVDLDGCRRGDSGESGDSKRRDLHDVKSEGSA